MGKKEKKTYRVTLEETVVCDVFVEADSIKDAVAKTEEKMTDFYFSDCDIVFISQIKNNIRSVVVEEDNE